MTESPVSLIVAALDLKVVRLIRDAIRTADLSSRPPGGAFITPAAQFAPRQTIHPTPRFEPRPVVHPTPRFEPRPVLQAERRDPAARPNDVPLNPEQPRITPSPVQPVWKTLPPLHHPAPARMALKRARGRNDQMSVGTLFDAFI